MTVRCRPSAAALLLLVASFAVANPRSEASGITGDSTKTNRQWIAVCPTAWAGALAPLRDYRAGQGRPACIWTFADLAASYGGYGPTQIRQALSDAYTNWTVKPRWVCLVGDHDANGGAEDLIADWKLYNPELGRWEDYIRGLWPYMDLNDDNVPELAVGRIPASSTTDVANYITKIQRHDTDLNNHVGYSASTMVIEDENRNGNDSLWVRQLGDSLYRTWDLAPSKQTIYYSALPCCDGSPKAAVVNAWNQGPGVVTALGNGSNWFLLVHFWDLCDYNYWWSISDLAPTNKFPALLGLSCGVTASDHVIYSSCDWQRPITEQLLVATSNSGASVVIGPMRNTYQYGDFVIGKHLLHRKYLNDHTWGEVFVNAMHDALVEDPAVFDHVYQYVLEGDPAAQATPFDVAGVPTSGRTLALELRLPFPNPARERAQVTYNLPNPGKIRLEICDVAGRRIRLLADRAEDPGAYTAVWDLTDDSGERVRAGVYFVRLRQSLRTLTHRIIVVQ